ncbi:hypothetical protein SEA_PLATTE_82 [Microbacterium phage Platte]|nr:hypothetical protein SEA_PIONEER3_83 [Microbacterium phage Pioneer3]QZD97674.1 hypothetical protein SEA_PLATTE_82 [Microbacterium phage Platte]
MSDNKRERIQVAVDTIVRDEGYDGFAGALTEKEFNLMAERIAQEVMSVLDEEGVL